MPYQADDAPVLRHINAQYSLKSQKYSKFENPMAYMAGSKKFSNARIA